MLLTGRVYGCMAAPAEEGSETENKTKNANYSVILLCMRGGVVQGNRQPSGATKIIQFQSKHMNVCGYVIYLTRYSIVFRKREHVRFGKNR